MLSALNNPDLGAQQRERIAIGQARYRCLRAALDDAGLVSSPFNSGFFALIEVDGDPNALRLRLLERGVGVVALPQHGAIRVAFSSTAIEHIPELVKTIASEIGTQT